MTPTPRPAAMVPLAALWVCTGVLLCQCTTDDTGTVCSNPNITDISSSTVQGEQPVVEVIHLGRDPTCQTFDCLTHMGIPSYCTRSCTNSAIPGKAQSCTLDSDCQQPYHCNKGTCAKDDCPGGFYCKTVQDVGPLADQYFCVRRTGCASDVQCGQVGVLTCQAQACFDECYQDPNCLFHQYVCQSDQSADCGCAGGASSCSDGSTMQCPPASQGPAQYTATRHDICLPAH